MFWFFVLIGLICLDFCAEWVLKRQGVLVEGQSSKTKRVLSWVFKYRVITIISLVFFSTFKSLDCGLDTYNYYRYYTNLLDGKSIPFVSYLGNKFEMGYTFLNSILTTLNLPFRCLLFTISLFVSIVIVLFVNKVSVNKFMSLILYVALGVFAQSLSAYRQIIAMAFVLIAIIRLVDKKWISSIICIMLGSIFHVSALICLVIVPLRYFKPRLWFVCLAFIIVAVGSHIFPDVLRLMEKFTPIDYYTKYYDRLIFVVESDWVNTLYSLSLAAIFIVMYVAKYKWLKLYERESRLYDFFLLIYMFVPLFRMAGFIIHMPQLFNRLNMYFFTSLLILIPLFVKGLKHNKKLYIAANIMVYVIAGGFMIYLYAAKNTCGVCPFIFGF